LQANKAEKTEEIRLLRRESGRKIRARKGHVKRYRPRAKPLIRHKKV
jgi:hypothetical protein